MRFYKNVFIYGIIAIIMLKAITQEDAMKIYLNHQLVTEVMIKKGDLKTALRVIEQMEGYNTLETVDGETITLESDGYSKTFSADDIREAGGK
jgi:hypothetical protein